MKKTELGMCSSVTPTEGRAPAEAQKGLCHQAGGAGMGTGVPDGKAGRCEHDL